MVGAVRPAGRRAIVRATGERHGPEESCHRHRPGRILAAKLIWRGPDQTNPGGTAVRDNCIEECPRCAWDFEQLADRAAAATGDRQHESGIGGVDLANQFIHCRIT